MRTSIFRNNEKNLRTISTFGNWFMSLKFISEDQDWMRTRLPNLDNGKMLDTCGISFIPENLRSRCYNSGGFWDHDYDSFDWRSETIHPKGLGGISYNPYY